MKSEDDHRAEGAIIMQDVAERAVRAAKQAMLDEIERSIPEDGGPRNGGRQMGAAITASTMLYANMLDTFAQHGGRGEAILIAGLLKSLVAEPLTNLATKAGGKCRINIGGVD
jgi:hypothetical protein